MCTFRRWGKQHSEDFGPSVEGHAVHWKHSQDRADSKQWAVISQLVRKPTVSTKCSRVLAALGQYLAGGEDKPVAHQVCFIREHLGQFFAHFPGQLPQPQQVVVDGHPCYGLRQRTGLETWASSLSLLSSLQSSWGH